MFFSVRKWTIWRKWHVEWHYCYHSFMKWKGMNFLSREGILVDIVHAVRQHQWRIKFMKMICEARNKTKLRIFDMKYRAQFKFVMWIVFSMLMCVTWQIFSLRSKKGNGILWHDDNKRNINWCELRMKYSIWWW